MLRVGAARALPLGPVVAAGLPRLVHLARPELLVNQVLSARPRTSAARKSGMLWGVHDEHGIPGNDLIGDRLLGGTPDEDVDYVIARCFWAAT